MKIYVTFVFKFEWRTTQAELFQINLHVLGKTAFSRIDLKRD